MNAWYRLGAATLLSAGLNTSLLAAPESAHGPEGAASCIGVRLADGSELRVPLGVGEPASPAPALSNSDSVPWAPPRSIHKRRTQVFDARTPGAIAAVRG